MSKVDGIHSIVATAERRQVIEIHIEPARKGSRRLFQKNGQLWDVSVSGSHLLRSRDAEHAAARALLARGLRGTMHVFHKDSDICTLSTNIAWAAKRKVSETASEGPILRPYREWNGIKRGEHCKPRSLEKHRIRSEQSSCSGGTSHLDAARGSETGRRNGGN